MAQLQILAEVYDKQTPPFTSGEQSLQRSSMIKNYLLHGDKNIYIYMQIIYELDTHYITHYTRAYVYVQIYYRQCICIRADIRAYVYVRIYIMGSAHVYVQIHYRHMYTCGYIFLMLLRLAVHICIRADILRAYVYVRIYIY